MNNNIPENFSSDFSSNISYSISNQFVFKWIESLVITQKDLHSLLGEMIEKLDDEIMRKETWVTRK